MKRTLSLHSLFFGALLTLCFSQSFSQATFTSRVTTGFWNTSSTWIFSGEDEDSIPDANDSVFISISIENHNISIPENFTAQCFALVIGSSGKGKTSGLSLQSSSSLFVLTSVKILQPESGTRFLEIGNGSVNINGNATISSYALSPSSISRISLLNGSLRINGDLSLMAIVAGNAIIDGTNGASQIELGGQVYLNPKGMFSLSSESTVKFYSNQPQQILSQPYGSIIFSGGEKILHGDISAQSFTIVNDVQVNGQQHSIRIFGDWNNYGTFTSTGTVHFTGDNQLITPTSFYSTVFEGNGVKTLLGDVSVLGNLAIKEHSILDGGNNTLTIGGSWKNENLFYSSGTVKFIGNEQEIFSSTFNNVVFASSGAKLLLGELTIGGSVIVENGTTLYAGNYNHNIAGNWTNNGTVLSEGTFNFNGSDQTINASTFYNLHLSGTGTKTATGNIVVNNKWLVDNNVTFHAGNSNHTIHGTFLLNGTLSAGTSTFIFQGSSKQEIAPATYFNIILNNSSGVFLKENISVLNTITLQSGELFTGLNKVSLEENASLVETSGNTIVGTVTTLRNVISGEIQQFGNIGLELLALNNSPGPTLVTRTTGFTIPASPTFSENSSIRRYFTIVPTDNNNLNATIVFHYDESEIGNQNEETFNVWNSLDENEPMTRSRNGTQRNTSANTVAISGAPSVFKFTVADENNHLFGGILTVKKFSDRDGDTGTNSDREIQSSHFEIRRDSPSGQLFAYVENDTLLFVSDVPPGNYSIVQRDDFGWNNLGYNVNGQFTSGNDTHVEISASAGLQTNIEFVSYSQNTIIIKPTWDMDGNVYTLRDRKARKWNVELHKDSPTGPLVELTVSDSNYFATQLEDGIYYIVGEDSVRWKYLGYSIDKNAVITSQGNFSVPVAVNNRKIHTARLFFFHPNTITVRTYRDPDGNVETLEGRELISWHLSLFQNNRDQENRVYSASTNEVTINNLGNGIYFLEQQKQRGWLPRGYIVNGVLFNSSSNVTTFHLTGGDSFDITLLQFHPNTLSMEFIGDGDGILSTTDDRQILPWSYTLFSDSVNSLQKISIENVQSVTLDTLGDGAYFLVPNDSVGFEQLGYYFNNELILNANTSPISLSLMGGGIHSNIQYVYFTTTAKKFITFLQDSLGKKSYSLQKKQTKRDSSTTRKPFIANVRDSAFKNYITPKLGQLYLGVPQNEKSTISQFGWVKLSKAQRKFAPHNQPSNKFSHTKEAKNPVISRVNNKLAGELYALKLAIAASDANITPTGLGELIFNDETNATHPFNGKSLREIAPIELNGAIDSILTYGDETSEYAYEQFHLWLRTINEAFSGTMETLNTNPLRVRGKTPLASIVFLRPSLKKKPSISEEPVDVDIPRKFSFLQNHPNPFNPSTSIGFQLAKESEVSVKIYNLLGQEIATVIESEEYPEGSYTFDFDASLLSSGIYFCRLTAIPLDGEGLPTHLIKKMMLMK
ncbi:MAG: T9SS type A sorting domain-containing protein [Ignavibacteriales bacterium]|nr:T9SS type A sorting domain-containing protein [Ignavibacteriales bacterium]